MHDGYEILQGDCLDVLRGMASESVHCCVTSPPYFGLRDYGTAEWDISNAEDAEIAGKCDHKIESQGKPTWGEGSTGSSTLAGKPTNDNHDKEAHFRDICGKCGAVRIDAQIGLEASPQLFIAKMVEVFEEVRRVLRSDGVLFLNLGDSYWGGKGQSGGASPERQDERNESGASINKSYQQLTGAGITRPTDMKSDIFKPKDLMLIPHRVAIALQDAGWWVRSDMPWVKRSAMPESVTDRPAKALEYMFMLTKSKDYYFDMQAVRVARSTDDDAKIFRGGAYVGGNTNNATIGIRTVSGNKSASGRDRSLPSNRNGITGSLDNWGRKTSAPSAELETAFAGNPPTNYERCGDSPAGGRNFRNTDLWYSSVKEPHGLVGIGDDLVGLDVNPAGFKESHFATFPPKLIEPLIKAGTSEKGVCSDCGSPWERMTDKELTETRAVATAGPHGEHGFMGGNRRDEPNKITTLGWQKTCKCTTDETVPATVLDPFAGAGTTLLVSKRLGRRSIGIELNPEYIKLIERRLEHWHKPAPPPVKDEGCGPLFDQIKEVAA